MFKKLRTRIKCYRMTMRMKLTLALSSITMILIISSVISILEYTRMSNYVSTLIADNIESINAAQQIANETDAYNLQILSVVGEDGANEVPDFNREAFISHCDSLRSALTSINKQNLADSLVYSWSAYMLTSLELPNVLQSDFIDTRSWYFERLQVVYNRMHRDIDVLNNAIFSELRRNSETFERGFYRSIIPGAVAVGVGIVLVLLLLTFILAFYVNPIYKMLRGLNNYRSLNKKYTYSFEGDDQLKELNDGLTEVIEENQQLRKRVRTLRDAISQKDIQ
ncbi:MAG: MCP four helix bundle domain-containing protein [Bacteroidales bacterium]|nr:MCP four helix bundle domain-containing protein [Bacteroidales bacterium]